MARVLLLENAQQVGGCLARDFAEYVKRIPPRFNSFVDAVDAISRAPYDADDGRSANDANAACMPAQRSRIWPESFNCWEASAHVAAEGARLLPSSWVIVVRDQTESGRRHVWPTITLPGVLTPLQPANVSAGDVFETVGRVVLGVGEAVGRAYGLGPAIDAAKPLIMPGDRELTQSKTVSQVLGTIEDMTTSDGMDSAI